jgi:hypothetical protein
LCIVLLKQQLIVNDGRALLHFSFPGAIEAELGRGFAGGQADDDQERNPEITGQKEVGAVVGAVAGVVAGAK